MQYFVTTSVCSARDRPSLVAVRDEKRAATRLFVILRPLFQRAIYECPPLKILLETRHVAFAQLIKCSLKKADFIYPRCVGAVGTNVFSRAFYINISWLLPVCSLKSFLLSPELDPLWSAIEIFRDIREIQFRDRTAVFVSLQLNDRFN